MGASYKLLSLPRLYKRLFCCEASDWVPERHGVLSLLWCTFDTWPGDFCMPQVAKKKESEQRMFTHHPVDVIGSCEVLTGRQHLPLGPCDPPTPSPVCKPFCVRIPPEILHRAFAFLTERRVVNIFSNHEKGPGSFFFQWPHCRVV